MLDADQMDVDTAQVHRAAIDITWYDFIEGKIGNGASREFALCVEVANDLMGNISQLEPRSNGVLTFLGIIFYPI